MQYDTKKFQMPRFLFILIMLLLLNVTSISALANGKDHHHPDTGMSEHMQSMLAVKDGIPEEYQIMERSPILPDKDSLQVGRKLFMQNCSVCHGENGDGKGLAAAALKTLPANFLDKEHSAIYGPGGKFWIIGHGTEKTGMPAFPQLSFVDRWHLVNYIFHLQDENSKSQKGHSYH